MIKFLVGFPFLILFLSACNEQRREIHFACEEIILPISDTVHYQTSFSDGQTIGDTLFLFDKLSHSMLIYDLKARVFLREIDFKHTLYESEDSFGSISRLLVYTQDSIFALQEFRITLFNKQGNLLHQWDINTDSLDELYYYPYSQSSDYPIYYDNTTKNLYMECYSKLLGDNPNNRYKNSIEASFSLETGKFKAVPQTFPKSYIGKYYGMADDISRCVNGTKHVYSFMTDPNLYVLDVRTNKKAEYVTQGKYHRTKVEPISYQKESSDDYEDLKIQKLTEYPLYFNLIYDKYRNCYYRTLLASQEYENKDGSFNAFRDKDYVLMAYDENFQITAEEKEKNNNFGSPFFVSPQGLFGIKKVNKNKLVLSLISLTSK